MITLLIDISLINLIKNILAVKKDVVLCKNELGEIRCEIQTGGQEMAVDGKILITTIQVNLCCLVPASLGVGTKFISCMLKMYSCK